MDKSHKIISIILAAGESNRMGTPKALLKIKNTTFLKHLISTNISAGISNLIVVLGCEAEKILDNLSLNNFSDYNIKILINQNYKLGQLSSIQTAIENLPDNVEAIILCPVDRPLVTRDVIQLLVQKYLESQAKIVVPIFNGKRGHPVIFSNKVFKELLQAPLDVGARQVVWNNASDVLEVSTSDSGILINIDTPEDYKEYILKSEL